MHNAHAQQTCMHCTIHNANFNSSYEFAISCLLLTDLYMTGQVAAAVRPAPHKGEKQIKAVPTVVARRRN